MGDYRGLTAIEAAAKLKEFGRNEIPEEKGKWLKSISAKIISPISLMLIAAAVISYFDGRIFDFYFIASLWFINFFIAFWHEKKTDDAIKKLQAKLSVTADVLRNGAWRQLPAAEIVTDDIIRLNGGKIIPADVNFLETKNVSVNESALTGESLPQDKKEGDFAYSGAFLVTGLAIAKVTATGRNTYFGKTLLAVEKSKKRSVLENDILSIARYLAVMSIAAVIVLTAILLFYRAPLFDLLTIDLSLIIAGIPVSLPTVMTLIISLGVMELVKKNVIIRRLSSLEDLSNVDLLLSDKTGTLTKNELAVSEIIPYNHATAQNVISFAYATTLPGSGGPIETAIIKRFQAENIAEDIKILDFVPADSERKRSTAIAEISNRPYAITVGAPQVIADLTKIQGQDSQNFDRDIKLAAQGGYRVLAVAVAEGQTETNLNLVGALLISDTPEPDAKNTLTFMKENNINVKILTGDNIAISERLAKEMGLTGKVVNRTALAAAEGDALKQVFSETAVFSEILPADKYKLVELGKEEHRVAVTGDGVNDIPAVKAADVGIAVANAVDALKGAADIVLLSAGIAVIKDAIIEARKIFARLYTYSLYRISESLRLIISIALLAILYVQYPMSPIQILILAILNDIPIISLAYDKVRIASKPAKINIKKRTVLGSLYGLTGVTGSVIFAVICRQVFHLNWDVIQTLFFLKLSLGGHMLIYVAHTKERWWKFLPSRAVILATSITQLVATIITVSGTFMSPIALTWALLVWLWAFFWMQVSELVKWLATKNEPAVS